MPTHFNKKIMPLLPIKLEFWGQIIWGLWRIWMKNDLREPSWFDTTLNKSFMGHSISTKLSGQFLPWLKNNYMKFGGCDIPNLTAMPIFQQICLGMQEAHTVFCQCSASTASRLSRIFSGWFTFQKILMSNIFQYKNIFIINNKSWILR